MLFCCRFLDFEREKKVNNKSKWVFIRVWVKYNVNEKFEINNKKKLFKKESIKKKEASATSVEISYFE